MMLTSTYAKSVEDDRPPPTPTDPKKKSLRCVLAPSRDKLRTRWKRVSQIPVNVIIDVYKFGIYSDCCLFIMV